MLFTERLTGRLVANAKLADVNDNQVVNFTLAINDRYKTKEGELKESVTFIDCAIWNRPKVAEFLTKGALIEASGLLSPRAYLNASNEPKAALSLNVKRFKFHSSSKGQSSPAPSDNKKQTFGKTTSRNKKGTKAVAAADITEPIDDLPF